MGRPVVHWELMSNDPAGVSEFYAKIFGWKVTHHPEINYRIVETGAVDGVRVDYLDGVVFSADECYLCLGTQTSEPGPVSDYTGQDIYYRSIQHDRGTKHDRLTIADYLWRWDTDWFWCSRAFGAQNPRLRRWWPRRYRRSSFYWKLLAYDQRSHR